MQNIKKYPKTIIAFFIKFILIITISSFLTPVFSNDGIDMDEQIKEYQKRRDNNKTLWGKIFNSAQHKQTITDSDVKFLQEALEINPDPINPDDKYIIKYRALDASGKVIWDSYQTYDLIFDSNYNVLKRYGFKEATTSEDDRLQNVDYGKQEPNYLGCMFGYDKTQKIRIKQRYFTSEGKVNWQDEDSWDREFDELGRIIKSIIYTSDSNSEEDKQVNWDSDYTYYCFYDQQGKQLHSVTRNRHYKLENGKIQVDWASEKTFDQKFNDDGSRNMRYFTQDGKINWENENTCNYDAIGNTQNLEGTQISSQERELEDKLQVYKKEAYNYVLEIELT
ncbi:hypothetical protein [Candidatus Phytoplasma asteris]|uniref:Secreted protein n=5 Tax=16SrI (Aster yellows group) TaxID=3042590 RepID=A0ABZ3CEY4_9MOLU|nr:MAG: putative secreted protein [Rapeseed phyllody phytoplasma]